MDVAPDGSLPPWQPATGLEVALRDALHQRDEDSYARLLSTAEIFLPLPERPPGNGPGWTTWTVEGRVHVLAFTSAQALATCLPEHRGGYRTLAYPELAAEWPSEEWWLAVNPGLPIEAYLPWWFVEQTGRGQDPRPPARPASADQAAAGPFSPADPTEAALADAAAAGDVEAYLRALLGAQVLVPVSPETPPHATLGDAAFDWLTLLFDDGTRTVPVFTSPRLVPEPLAAARMVAVEVVDLVRVRPVAPWPLAVNPGTPIGIILPPDQVGAVAGWLADALPGLADGPRDGTVIMQKVLASGQLDHYLARGYDRVGGAVHRVADLADLDSPAALLAATAGPMEAAEGAEPVHLIRWPAYRWSLYLPREPAPRRVPAFSVASIRLPHGAELYRLDVGGEESLVAVLDADQRRWRTAGEVSA